MEAFTGIIKKFAEGTGISEPLLWVAAGAVGFWILSRLFRKTAAGVHHTGPQAGRTYPYRSATSSLRTSDADQIAVNLDGREFSITGEAASRIKDAISGGNKIAAIKIFREETGTGLAEAKQAIELLE